MNLGSAGDTGGAGTTDAPTDGTTPSLGDTAGGATADATSPPPGDTAGADASEETLASVDCATIVVREGHSVAPLTKLHLTASGAAASSFAWSVEAPAGAMTAFAPSSAINAPLFEADVVGTYTFHLHVVGAQGDACDAPPVVVRVAPPGDLYLELLWHTPGDPDESDSGPVQGSDLDLHFTHPFAAGPDLDHDGEPDAWFDSVFDCYWQNGSPNWGSLDPAIDDNPHMLRDDTDGAGPESLSISELENVCYRVGVHVFTDHGFGPSDATVRVFSFGHAIYEATATLAHHDLWTVGSICAPSETFSPANVCAGTFTACAHDADCGVGGTCGARIAHDYSNPKVPAP